MTKEEFKEWLYGQMFGVICACAVDAKILRPLVEDLACDAYDMLFPEK
jgi:hypothetical protein